MLTRSLIIRQMHCHLNWRWCKSVRKRQCITLVTNCSYSKDNEFSNYLILKSACRLINLINNPNNLNSPYKRNSGPLQLLFASP